MAMLPGNNPGVMGENIRMAKRGGMSERDAVMAAAGNAPAQVEDTGPGTEIVCPKCGEQIHLEASSPAAGPDDGPDAEPDADVDDGA